jgi:ubiquinone/menaquinone biosynthesis C-methylase UbiE/uncharacterized protein YbaR (Trm112 family)
MARRNTRIIPAVAATNAGLAAVRQQRRTASEQQTWQDSRRFNLDVLACPDCKGKLTLEAEWLNCPDCQKVYQIKEGIPQFIQAQQLSGLNGSFAGMYDWFSVFYRLFSTVAFAYIGMPEAQARREVTDRLDPQGGRVLEVSIGPGVNLPYLSGRPDIGEVYGMDISQGQLNSCRDFAAHRKLDIQLQLANAEALPYQDNTFAGVLHIGGINFFNDRKKAIAEMVRVAQPGARILISDENEKGAQMYERFIPGFKRLRQSRQEAIQAPADLLPNGMLDVRVTQVWKGWFYCLEFRKP